jgi:putative oxidoreductase
VPARHPTRAAAVTAAAAARAAAADVALLLARLVLATVVVTHGYQQLVVDGLGRTADGMPYASVSVAIVAASLATVVELVGGLLLALGVFSRTAAVLTGLVVVAGAVSVRVPHGLLVAGGGWALVAAIAGGLAALAGTGPGRCSVAHLARAHRARPAPAAPPLPAPAPSAFEEQVPAAGLPFVPVVPIRGR